MAMLECVKEVERCGEGGRKEEGDQEGRDIISWNGDGAEVQATSSRVGQVRSGTILNNVKC